MGWTQRAFGKTFFVFFLSFLMHMSITYQFKHKRTQVILFITGGNVGGMNGLGNGSNKFSLIYVIFVIDRNGSCQVSSQDFLAEYLNSVKYN